LDVSTTSRMRKLRQAVAKFCGRALP